MKDVKLPSADQEAANPDASDNLYEACCAFLREKTRDSQIFNLIFEENCNYGFRRNLWGMKPIALTLALLSLAAIVAVPICESSAQTGRHLGLVALTGSLDALLLLGWVFMFKPDWVRIPAEAYAERLLEACERL
jgi:hypothetical protein